MREPPPPSLDPIALQEAIARIPDVRAARVVGDRHGRITEVHVVAEGLKSAKQLVRDVQTIAQAEFGFTLDYRTVSVVKMGQEGTVATPAAEPEARLVLQAVSYRTEQGTASSRVELALGDQHVRGEASGAATGMTRLRLVAQATAQALASLDGMAQHLDVADVRISETVGHRIAMVVLVLVAGCSEDVLVGSALVRADEADAVARAVLDAINRRLPYLGRPGA